MVCKYNAILTGKMLKFEPENNWQMIRRTCTVGSRIATIGLSESTVYRKDKKIHISPSCSETLGRLYTCLGAQGFTREVS